MPTENELKYVFRRPKDSNKLFNELAKQGEWYSIHQGYLTQSKDITVRIRGKMHSSGMTQNTMTVKKQTKKRLVEIETEISPDDMYDLWQKTFNRVDKLRVYLDGWEIDFFQTGNLKDKQTYFIQAEYEMPEGQAHPDVIPDFVANNLLFAVPRDDNRFSNKKLANVAYAEKLWFELHKKIA